MFKKLYSFLIYFIPGFLLISLFSGVLYITLQNNYRQNANDPQIQIAEDMANYLAAGISPQTLISTGLPVDIASSLGTYAIVFDESGKVVLSSAKLRGKDVELPAGTLEYAKANKENRITWEPEEGITSAVVVVHYDGAADGYVAVGRSLREVEKRESQLTKIVFWGWLISLFIVLLFSVGFSYRWVTLRQM
jgi:hypothetical protein